MELLNLKKTSTSKKKIHLMNLSLDTTEKQVSDHKDRSIGIIQMENKEKKILIKPCIES